MKLLGTITKTMFYNNDKTIAKDYIIPYDGSFLSIDIGRLVYLTQDNEIVLESYKDKKNRELRNWVLDNE